MFQSLLFIADFFMINLIICLAATILITIQPFDWIILVLMVRSNDTTVSTSINNFY